MAINTSWTVKIGTVASPTDFTSRVMGIQIDQQVDVNEIGRGRCVITLLNRDGALTPGGGGTYTSTDWFAQGVFVACLTNTGGADTIHQVFHGIVVDFDLQDDGVYSTVTITAQDGLSVAGRTQNVALPAAVTTNYSVVAPASLGNGYASGYSLNYPQLGASTATAAWTNLATSDPTVTTTTSLYSTAADLLQTSVIPSVNDVMWATTITGTTTATYTTVSIPNTNSRAVANQTDFEFDPASGVSGSKLPFDVFTFQQGFNNDTLITGASIKGAFGGATTQTSTASTVNTYGNRTSAYLAAYVENDTAASTMATKLVNRYGTSRFTPISLQLTATLVKRLADDSAVGKWRHLLDVEKGFWQRAKITWTGSGAASQTAYCVIKGRSISVTPADTVVTLSLGNWADNHAFILDTDQLNVDRLG